MAKISFRLCWHGMAALTVLQGIAMAQPLSLSQLREQILEHRTISGRFVQCTTHGSASIFGAGKFTVEPDNRIELNFEQPNRYSIEFFRDGTQTKTIGGMKQKIPKHSPLGSLIFSIMSMQKSALEHRFEINLDGTIDKFSMSLIPKKRLSKILRSVEIAGVAGLVNTLQITTRDNRVISIYLLPAEQPAGVVCG